MTLTITELYDRAERRITGSRLAEHIQEFAMAEGFTGAEDHLRWLLTAKLSEIRGWAEQCLE